MSRALAASPAGDVIGRGVQSASDHIAGSLLSIGINPTRAYYATIGAIALGTLAFGATKAIKYVRQTADEIANLRTPLAPEFSDFDISLFDGKNVPLINQGKQGKHILGNNNFETGKSVLTADPKALALQAGSGIPVNAVPRGQAGFKERVNFGEVIGDYVFQGTSQPTTNGIIVYDKAGTIHIIPSRPN